MGILIADFIFVKAHQDMNINFIHAVRKFTDIDVISLNGFYDNQREDFLREKINILEITMDRRIGPIKSRLFNLGLMKRIANIAKNKHYTAVICLGFETITLGLGINEFGDTPLFLFHHKNIDELTSKVKLFLFNAYKNKVYHVVFESFFKDRLVNDIGIPLDKVFVVPHPVNPIVNKQTEKRYDCIGLCNSNDETFITEAFNRRDEFEKKNLHILLRSKKLECNSGSVEIIKGFLEHDEYEELMSAGRTVFVPLPQTYVYRLSGSIYDALCRGKIVFTTSKFYANEYDKRYPGSCYFVETVEQLMNLLELEAKINMCNVFDKFLEDHSIENVSQAIERMISVVRSGM